MHRFIHYMPAYGCYEPSTHTRYDVGKLLPPLHGGYAPNYDSLATSLMNNQSLRPHPIHFTYAYDHAAGWHMMAKRQSFINRLQRALNININRNSNNNQSSSERENAGDNENIVTAYVRCSRCDSCRSRGTILDMIVSYCAFAK
jgi:hypothetical protein